MPRPGLWAWLRKRIWVRVAVVVLACVVVLGALLYQRTKGGEPVGMPEVPTVEVAHPPDGAHGGRGMKAAEGTKERSEWSQQHLSTLGRLQARLGKMLVSTVMNGDADEVNRLRERGADPNAVDNEGWTPLHRAVLEGHIEICGALLAKGADVGATRFDGETALHHAAEYGRTQEAEVLLAQGAEVESRDDEGNTPLHHAAESGQDAMIGVLLAKGPTLTPKTILVTRRCW